MLQFKEGIRRSAWFLFAAWCVFAVGIWLQAQQTIRTISTVDELSSKIDEVRNIFNFELPYRAQHVDEVSLKLQLVYAVRLQLESEYSHRLGAPDLTQLFYLTDRFLEGARTFIGSDSELVALADQLHNSRESGSNSLELRTMYYRLGAMVLEAMFSDAATSTDTYQELDLLFTASQGLDVKEQASFQRRLDQTSSVLAAHAQGSHLSNQLLNPELPNQLASVIGSLERKLTFYITFLTLVSGSLLAAYSWAVFAKKAPTSQAALTSVQEKGSLLIHLLLNPAPKKGNLRLLGKMNKKLMLIYFARKNKMLCNLPLRASTLRLMLPQSMSHILISRKCWTLYLTTKIRYACC